MSSRRSTLRDREARDPGTAGVKHLFIVRISSCPSETSSAWRGSVVYVPTKRRFYFSDLVALHQFISEHIKHV